MVSQQTLSLNLRFITMVKTTMTREHQTSRSSEVTSNPATTTSMILGITDGSNLNVTVYKLNERIFVSGLSLFGCIYMVEENINTLQERRKNQRRMTQGTSNSFKKKIWLCHGLLAQRKRIQVNLSSTTPLLRKFVRQLKLHSMIVRTQLNCSRLKACFET